MYAHRRMTPAQREAILAERRLLKLPWHAPPHFGDGANTHLITAACWEHHPVLSSPRRLTEWESKLLPLLASIPATVVLAWVVLPNHYHLLVRTDLALLRPRLGRLHNGVATQWNREDGTVGRKVWFRFTDRAIRSEAHHFAALNYIHGNPVTHRCVADARGWPWSSLKAYEEKYGLDELRRWWRAYPVDRMGSGWDDQGSPDGDPTNGRS